MKYQDFKHLVAILPSDRKEKLDEMRKQDNIVGLSGGKDSMATAIIMHWLDILTDLPIGCLFPKHRICRER